MNSNLLPFWRSCLSNIKFAVLLAVALAGLSQPVFAQLTIQIVNDSGLADSNVFIMTPGALGSNTNVTITPTNLFVNKNSGVGTSVALSTLATNNAAPPFSIISSISGNTDTVYSIRADNIASGAIYFIYNNSFTFSNGVTPSPPPGSAGNAYRYDYAELSFDDNPAVDNDIDLTYVDKFGIPLQMEWFRGTNTTAANLLGGSYVYASTKTLANIFDGYSPSLSNAVYSLGATDISPAWQYTGPNSYTNFARILAPQKVTSATYPSVTNYLNSLIGHPFKLNGASVQGSNPGYYYLGYDVSVTSSAGNWLFALTYDSNSVPSDYSLSDIGVVTNMVYVTNGITVTTNYYQVQQQYTNTITFTVSGSNANNYIYGAPVGAGNYSTNSVLVTTNTSSSYDAEVWMIGDVLSAINYGFWNGSYGANSEQWYSTVEWTSYPFGWARPVNDGFYNPYAALMYYNADAYTFAFSERITPDVGLPPVDGDTVRITILPDDRLDSPVVSVPTNLITSNSVTLDWNPVPGATSYQVNVLRPLGFGSTNVSFNGYTLSGLAAGTPYVMSVQAMETNNANPVITPARPVSATTTGNYLPVTDGTFTAVQIGFSVSDPFYQLGYVSINGTQLFRTNSVNSSPWQNANGVPARWVASVGTNQVPVTVYDNNGNVLFNDWLTFAFSNTNNTGFSTVSDVFLYGQKIGTTPTLATPTNFLVSTSSYNVIINLNYIPAEIRKYAPALSTPSTNSPVVITNVTSLPGGGIQFAFDVPSGTNYVVESSSNLINWQTNFSGVGQPGGESYTNATGTNAVQFYRVKL